MPRNLAQEITELKQNPLDYLQRHPLQIVSSLDGEVLLKATEAQRDQATRTTSVLGRTVPATEGLRLAKSSSGDIPAYSVSGHVWDGQLVFLDIPAPTPHGPHLIVTSMLSGCTFVVEENDGSGVRCAHALPKGSGYTGFQVRDAAGGKGIQGYSRICGAGREYNSDTEVVAILGVAIKGKWCFFSQKQIKKGIAGEASILNVNQIF